MTEILKEYVLADGTRLKLNKSGFKHIIEGEINTKPVGTGNGRIVKEVLGGGLHTVTGWKLLHAKHPDIEHLYNYEPDKHSDWFYARELQNEVILIKLPSSMMTSKAAKMTRFPENYYKSGYLWKTLFPMSVDATNFLDILDEVFQNINYKESSRGELIGYFNCDEELKMIRVTVLYRDGRINSVYPSWSQPNTGNNGKPFSYFENIGHSIALSTIFHNVGRTAKLFENSIFCDIESIDDLYRVTPNIFLDRSAPVGSLDEWRDSRVSQLKAFAENLTPEEVVEIYRYITDGMIYKNNFVFFHEILMTFGFEVIADQRGINSLLYAQNIIDGLYIIYFCSSGRELFPKLITLLLKGMVTHILVDNWNKRRIHLCMLELCCQSQDIDLIKLYLEGFGDSPSRREVFVEYDYESLGKREAYFNGFDYNDLPMEFLIIKRPPQDNTLKMNDLLTFMRDNLGESYSFRLNEPMREELLNRNLSVSHLKEMCELHMAYFSEKDFYSFGAKFNLLISKYIEYSEELCADVFKLIIRDYCKIQFAQRLRINLNYKEYSGVEALPFADSGVEYLYALILKHERLSNYSRVEVFLRNMRKLASFYNDNELEHMITEYENSNGKERPHLPKNINQILEELRDK